MSTLRDDPPTAIEAPAGETAEPRPVTVYEPAVFGLPPLRRYARDLLGRRQLIWHLARTNLKADNYNTAFGQIWLVLNPLMLAGVFIVGRSVIRPMGSPEERNILVAHLIMGFFFFTFTSDSLGAGGKSIIQNKGFVLNSSVPRAVFPLSSMARSFFEFLPLLVVLFGVQALLGQPFGLALLYLPLIVLGLMVFNTGLTFGASMLTVYYRDFGNVISFITRLWFWSTPILYRTDEIPEGIRPYLQLNPLYPFFAALEKIWQAEMPDPALFLWMAAWAVPVLVVGLFAFIARERGFAVRF